MSTNPVFNPEDVRGIDANVRAGFELGRYPSSQAAQRAVRSYRSVTVECEYLRVGVGADPRCEHDHTTNVNLLVRKDQVDTFVRHLATDPEVHTVRVSGTIVYTRPAQFSGIREDVLAELTK